MAWELKEKVQYCCRGNTISRHASTMLLGLVLEAMKVGLVLILAVSNIHVEI